MKRFHCVCGKEVFFEDLSCPACGRQLGFNPQTLQLITRPTFEQGVLWQALNGRLLRQCAHRQHTLECNWLLDNADPNSQCVACRLTRVIPSQSIPMNVHRWRLLERAKRRLVYSLLWLGLPVVPKQVDNVNGLAFDFMEDQRSNPLVKKKVVYTGHDNGVITLNAIEADEERRVAARIRLNEDYRTLLGHMRHESGHYYWMSLIRDSDKLWRFRHLFGDEGNYRQALDYYYMHGSVDNWQERHISAYASSHPWEDWAETWAHYLHMMDTMETAMQFGALPSANLHTSDFNCLASDWQQLTVLMNSLNHSMGLGDAYPFTLTKQVMVKLRFVHQVIDSKQRSSHAWIERY